MAFANSPYTSYQGVILLLIGMIVDDSIQPIKLALLGGNMPRIFTHICADHFPSPPNISKSTILPENYPHYLVIKKRGT